MSVSVRIPTPLRALTSDRDVVEAGGETLQHLVLDLERQFPGIGARIVDEDGEIRRFVNLFVNGEDVRFLDGLHTVLNQGDEVSIVPAVAGG